METLIHAIRPMTDKLTGIARYGRAISKVMCPVERERRQKAFDKVFFALSVEEQNEILSLI